MSERAPLPRIERDGERVYLVVEGGTLEGEERWRVHDCTFGPPHNPPGRRTAYPPPGPAACTLRVFVPAAGWKRVYTFRPGEARELTAEVGAAQLRGAGYLAEEKFDAAAWGPR